MKTNLFVPAKPSLSFSDYFDLDYDIEDILAYFGYSFLKQHRNLPHSTRELASLNYLQTWLENNLLHVTLTSETAKREFLIAPVLSVVAEIVPASIKVEYPLQMTEYLTGKLDYYLEAKHQLLIVEAKNANLERGFTQLAVELIALDLRFQEDHTIELLYGAVSVGKVWQFAILDRATQCVIQDVNFFSIPKETTELVRVLVAILEDEGTAPGIHRTALKQL
jgi:hypothetical protein